MTTITGYVYKDENDTAQYDPSTDITIAGVTITTTSNGEVVTTTTGDDGKYALDVLPGATYTLEISLPAEILCYSPEERRWATDHSTITGEQTVDVPLNPTQQVVVNIAAQYLPLNYGPPDFRYRVWHSGPIFTGSPNTILVHGAVIPFLWHDKKTPNKCFHLLDSFLQSKRYHQHNVWDFEYANWCILGMCCNYDNLKKYGDELTETISSVRTWNPDNGVNIIAHSFGGLIARYAAQNMPTRAVNKIITLDTGHFGFEIAQLADEFTDAQIDCVVQVRPGSEFLYKLDGAFIHNKYKLLSLAASEPLLVTVVSWTSSSLVEVSSDGSTRPDSINTPFVIVEHVNHKSISEINDVNHPVVEPIERLINDDSVDQHSQPSGDPYFTVVLSKKPQSEYPKLWSVVTLPSGHQKLECVRANKNNIDDPSTGYHAVVFNVKDVVFNVNDVQADKKKIKIEYISGKYEDGQLSRGQSTIRTDVIHN